MSRGPCVACRSRASRAPCGSPCQQRAAGQRGTALDQARAGLARGFVHDAEGASGRSRERASSASQPVRPSATLFIRTIRPSVSVVMTPSPMFSAGLAGRRSFSAARAAANCLHLNALFADAGRLPFRQAEHFLLNIQMMRQGHRAGDDNQGSWR